MTRVCVVTPVYKNEATLRALAGRVEEALAGRSWKLRLVVDGSPDGSLAVARELEAGDDRIAVTDLSVNVGQHRALARGLSDEPDADAWVCLDADLQDPPEAIPLLLDHLARLPFGAVFAGRRGRYERGGRLVTARLHRVALSWITGLPADAGAFVVLGPAARAAVLRLDAPSVVAAIGLSGLTVASVPVERAERPSGSSAWTSAARLRQSSKTLAWALRARLSGQAPATQRCTSVSV